MALELDLAETQRQAILRQPATAPLADVAGAVHAALEHPLDYPALRRALTPDDHVAIVVDEQLADLPRVLRPLLEHLVGAQITPDAITFVVPEGHASHAWVEDLPADFRHIQVEEHDPRNRKKLSYLATTRLGRRVYLNRTAIDADQLVVLSRRVYDPLLGHGGAEGAIFPGLGDAETQKELFGKLSMEAADRGTWPVRAEAAEIAWLLGAPFFLQIIEGSGNEVEGIVAGPIASSGEGQRLQDARWRVEVAAPAATVIARLSGSPPQHTFADVARALACASRVVVPGGKIIILSDGHPEPDAGGQMLRQADTPEEALTLLKDHATLDRANAFQWAHAARRANLYLLSALPADMVEEMFATPLDDVSQVERLVGNGPYLELVDADRSLAVIGE